MRVRLRVFPGLAVAALAAPLAAVLGSVTAAPGARAIPRLDLSPFPPAAPGETRWVIQLPGLLPSSSDQAISGNPRDWRVQVIVGQLAKVDCNMHSFSAQLRIEKGKADPVVPYLRVSDVGPMASTRMACPAGEPLQEKFVAMAGRPFVMPYNVSRPIVVYAPRPLVVRWRLWKAETQERPAGSF